MKKNVCNFLAVLCLLMGTVTMVSCSKDDDAPGGKQEPVVQMNLDEKAKTATIAVNKLDANTHVQLVYATARGQVLAEGFADDKGTALFKVEQLVGYEQILKVVVQENERGKTVKELKIPAATQQLTEQQLQSLLTKQAWNSVAKKSRVLIKNSDKTPYDRLVGEAQKTFKFETGGKFIFTVSSPMKHFDDKGTWTISNKVLTISTRIPIGPLEMKNVRVNKLTDSELSLLVELSDGLFLMGFEPEK